MTDYRNCAKRMRGSIFSLRILSNNSKRQMTNWKKLLGMSDSFAGQDHQNRAKLWRQQLKISTLQSQQPKKEDISRPKQVRKVDKTPPKRNNSKSTDRTPPKYGFLPQSKEEKPKTFPKPLQLFNDPIFYEFDYILPPQASQEQVFFQLDYLIDNVLLGGDSCLVTCGQSASGKTFSMNGQSYEQWRQHPEMSKKSGIIPRSLHYIFEKLKEYEECEIQPKVSVSFTEIFQPQYHKERPASYSYDSVKHQSERKCIKCAEEGVAMLYQRLKTRKVRSTAKNQLSSRSHFIVFVYINFFFEGEQYEGCLKLMDLASNERLGVTQHKEEMKFIISTLWDLQAILRQIKHNQKPKKDNRFDHLIGEYLKDAKIAVLLTVGPQEEEVQRLKTTLEFGKNIS